MPPSAADASPWLTGPPGAIIGLYVSVLAASLYAFAACGELVCLKFLIVVCVTVALTYVEQLAMIHLFGSRSSSYLLQCDGKGDACTVRARPRGVDGLSPGAARMWDMPSAAAQMMLMTATFWTLFAREKRKTDDADTRATYFGLLARTMTMWGGAAAVVLASLLARFSTFAQLVAGVLAGTLTGRVAWAVSNGTLS